MEPNPEDSHLIGMRALGERRIAEVFYRGGLRQAKHRHHTATFSFVASGRYKERIGRQSHERAASTLIFHPPDECHAVAFESNVRILSVEFRSVSNLGKISNCLERSSSHRSELVAWLGERLGHEMTRVDTASSLAIDGIVTELLAEGSRGKALAEEKGTPRWLANAIEFIHDNFTCTFSLEEVGHAAGVHSAHLSRTFRQKMGCTVGDHVRRLRFESACRQILSTNRSLCEIALEAGFADQSHFNRLFRTRMGITPHAYRKIHSTSEKSARFVQDFGSR